MASSYQGYARPTGFQRFGPSDAEIRKQQEEDNRKIRALEEQKNELDKRADKSERQLERKLNKEKVRSKNKELSVEEALAQADAVLSSLSVAVPPPTRNKSANNEPFTKKKSKMVKRPLSASLIDLLISSGRIAGKPNRI